MFSYERKQAIICGRGSFLNFSFHIMNAESLNFRAPLSEEKEGMNVKRIRNISAILHEYLHHHTGLIIILVAAFLAGFIASVVFGMQASPDTIDELRLYMNDFFQNMHQSGADPVALFKTGFTMHTINFLVLTLCAIILIGIPLVAVYAAIKGFMHGFTLFVMLRIYGFKTLLFILLGMLPHYVILVPCYLLVCLLCMNFAGSIRQDAHEIKTNFLHFLIGLFVLFVFALMATLLQAYVEPVFIRLISGLYLSD